MTELETKQAAEIAQLNKIIELLQGQVKNLRIWKDSWQRTAEGNYPSENQNG